MTETTEGGATPASQPAAVASATVANQTHITNIINVVVPERRQASGHHGGGAPRRDRHPSTSGASHHPSTSGVPNSPSTISNTPANAPSLASDEPLTTETHRGLNGALVTSIADGHGGVVSYSRDRVTGDYKFNFKDLNVELHTNSGAAGFTGTRFVPHGYDGADRLAMSATEGTGEGYGRRGGVYCDDNRFDLRDSVAASNHVVADVTADQLRTFLSHHRGIAQQLNAQALPLTVMGGRTVTAGDIDHAAPQFRACPANEPDTIVKRLR